MLDTVKVPEQFEPIFQKAQESVSKYFKKMRRKPSEGTIEIFNQRYILVRAASMSVDFFDTVLEMYKDKGQEEASVIARQILFDIAHSIGKADAKNFHEKMNLKNPIEKLSAGPVHFSHTGWAFVDISEESKPSPDENYFLIYDHPFSFESDAWLNAEKKSDFPVCIMNAGYSSGWCEESFGIKLVASEILCKAKGDDCCRFIMASPHKIEGHIKKYLKKMPNLAKRAKKYKIPGFFERKQMEDELKASEEKFRKLFEGFVDAVFVADPETQQLIDCNNQAEKLMGCSREEILSMRADQLHPQDMVKKAMEDFKRHAAGELRIIESELLTKDKRRIPVSINTGMIEIGGQPSLMGVFRDITDQRKAEQNLFKRTDELERFQKLAVGRELKMIELKKEIQKLKAQLTAK